MSTCEHGLYPGVDCKQCDAAYDAIVKAREAGKKAYKVLKEAVDESLINAFSNKFREEWIDPCYCNSMLAEFRTNVLTADSIRRRGQEHHGVPGMEYVPADERVQILAFVYTSFRDYCNEHKT